MYTLKAFATNNSLVPTTVNQIAIVGQLSKQSSTFSRTITEYVNEASPGLVLTAFSSVDDVNGAIPIPADILSIVQQVQAYIYTRQPTQVNDSIPLLETALSNQFLNIISGVLIGSLLPTDMVTADNGFLYPDFISFSVNTASEQNTIQLYFTDTYFATHYDAYEIVVLPPIVPIDTFLGTPTVVKAAIAAIAFDDTLNRIATARGGNPETLLTAFDFNYTNPTNSNDLTNVPWPVLIYGPMGDDSDLIVTAIQQYIAANTAGTLAQWEAIFPDIYNNTEFTFFPKWTSFAINNLQTVAGIYSNVCNLNNDITTISNFVTTYTPDFIAAHACSMPFPYKSLELLHIGSPKNRNNMFDLTQLFPDIINVANTDPDFNRMSMHTQQFLNLLTGAIFIAETANQFTGLSSPYIKLTRNGKLYISFSFNNYQFLVLTLFSDQPVSA